MKSLKCYLILLFGVSIVLLQACTEAKTEIPPDTKPVEKIVNVQVESVPTTRQAMPIISTGILTPKDQIRLSFKIGGVISEIYAREGQAVKKGQLLAQLEQAEIDVQIGKAEIALAKAERDLKRANDLYADTVGTLELVENATTGKDIASTNLRIAKFNQEYVKLYAPANGRILMRLAEPLEVTGPGNPILVMTPAGKAQVMKVGLADKDIVKVRLGNKAKVTFDAYPGEVFTASITEISELPDQQTGTFPVEFTVRSRGKILKNGFIGQIEIIPSTALTFYKIPVEALVEMSGSSAYIFTPDNNNNTAKRIAVTPQEIGSDYFTVVKTKQFQLKKVITEGAPYLSDGKKINIVEQLSSK